MLLAILIPAAVLGAASAAPTTAPAPVPATPESPPEAAAVLRIDGLDVYVDLGRGAGARVGDRVRILRPVRVLRPGAREALVDHFAVGEVELVEVGEVLGRARPDPQLARERSPLPSGRSTSTRAPSASTSPRPARPAGPTSRASAPRRGSPPANSRSTSPWRRRARAPGPWT